VQRWRSFFLSRPKSDFGAGADRKLDFQEDRQQIGEGRTVAELMDQRRTVVEGYKTTESFAGLCAERGIDAPILREAHAILFQGKKPAAALAALMTRGLKREAST
jgi:glycerol-3-phosphate dehydrogenase (NAD(P)+)